VIAWNKIKSIKRGTQLFQATQTVLQSLHVDGRTLMAPVAQKHAGFTPIGPGSGNKPINEVTAILIVNQAV
jgi:hypothetical protein